MEYSFSDSRWLSIEEIQSKKIIEEKNALGFHIPGMWNKVVDINKCWLQEDFTNIIRNSIKELSEMNTRLLVLNNTHLIDGIKKICI